MSLVSVSALNPSTTISTPETDDVFFTVAGTVNIVGPSGAPPIAVTLSSVTGVTTAATINISNAKVQLNGLVNASALINYNIGDNGSLTLGSTANVALGSTISFTGQTGNLSIANGLTLGALDKIDGFGPGKTIDLAGRTITSLSYADATGPNTGGTLTLTDSSNQTTTLTLGTGDYSAANFSVGSDGAAGTLISFASAVTGTTVTGGSGLLGLNATTTFNVALSDPVTVTGTPTLLLNDGGVATYDVNASTPTNLAFKYTVQPGENTPNLAITGVSLNGGALSTNNGGPVNLNSVVGAPIGTIGVDSVAPVLNTATLVPTGLSSIGTMLGLGSTANIVLTTSEPVTVTGGTPTLALNDGGTATFNPTASTPTSLVFSTTVAPGQNAAALAVTSTALNGATVTDLAGNVLSLLPVVGSLVGSLPVDTTAPTISSVVSTPSSATLGVGQVITLTATPSEAVTVTGTPTLALNDGGTATFDPTSSTPTQLVFHSTVAAGQNTPDLSVIGSSLNGGTITDAAGNAMNMAGFVTNPAGTLVVDTIAPVISAVTTNPGSGTLGIGGTVQIDVAVDSPVLVTRGTPTLSLSDGGTATFDAAASTSTMLVFDHTVASGQNTADLSVTAASTGGATIADAAGNPLNLQAAIGNPAGILAINTTSVLPPNPLAPAVVSVTTQPGSGNLTTGDTVDLTVTTDHGVTVSGGTPTLVLSDGGLATFDPTRSTPTSLVFHNTVLSGQTTSDLAVVGFDMNGSTIADSNGLSLPLSEAEVNPAGILSVGLNTGGGGGTTPTGGGGGGGTTPTGGGGGGTTTTGGDGGTTTTGGDGATTNGGVTGSNPTYATIPIYRFFETSNGTHFYTPSAQERDSIIANRPDLVSEGVGLYALDPNSGDPNATAVYRFFDKVHGTQFLTASASERDNVIANRSDLTYEPAGTFYEHTTAQPGDTAVYRFFSTNDGTHFYTDSATERATILQTRPDLVAEGVGFYEPKHT